MPHADRPAIRFPEGFLWGAATSAAQVEGGGDLDGRTDSIWDTFAAREGTVADGTVPGDAVGQRLRMHDDVAIMASLGLGAYRFSIAWSRVLPGGGTEVSSSGLDYYRALVDELLDAGIEPVVTLYHWDLPQALDDLGGWPTRAVAERFGDYARIVGAALGDRVRRWATINEPWCASMLGYASGVHAPGHRDPAEAVVAAHHLLLAHGLGVQALRSVATHDDLEVAISLNPYPVVAEGPDAADRDAARRVDGVANRLWYDPVLRGRYPDDVVDDFASVTSFDHVRDGDLDTISQPLDAIGVNYYRRHHVRFREGASVESPWCTWPGSPDVGEVDPGGPKTASGWAIEPDGLTEVLVSLAEEYEPPPIHVHENGAAFDDVVDQDGAVDDADRLAFLEGHVRALHAAIERGVDVRGYFVWSLLDNFEWSEGLAVRFGLVRVDHATGERTVKASGRWYGQVARRNGLD